MSKVITLTAEEKAEQINRCHQVIFALTVDENDNTITPEGRLDLINAKLALALLTAKPVGYATERAVYYEANNSGSTCFYGERQNEDDIELYALPVSIPIDQNDDE